MTVSVQTLHERIARTRVNRRGYRQYSEELRRDIQAHALDRLHRGDSYKDIAVKLGLAAATLQNWCKDADIGSGEAVRPMGFRPVDVTDERPERVTPTSETRGFRSVSRPVVVLPSGIRIEGLSMAELPGLLKELGCH